MANIEIKNYITKRYDRWLDYAKYHCKQAKTPDDAIEILNEVLLSLLQKDTEQLSGLLHREKDNYTELDWFVIRMINLNIKSPTSPFQRKTSREHIDDNTDPCLLQIEDQTADQTDIPAKTLMQMTLVRDTLASLPVPDPEKQIFSFRFFCGEPYRNWPGEESPRKLYSTYHKIETLIKEKLQGPPYFNPK